MRQWEQAQCSLTKKMQILDRLAANTEIQCVFIHREKARGLRGLKRVLRDRDGLIAELIAINEVLASDPAWKDSQELAPLIQDISNKQQAIIDRSSQVVQEIAAERARVAAELRNSREQRRFNTQYVNPWAVMVPGRRINERG